MSNGKNNKDKKQEIVTIDESESYINPYNFITLNKTGCKRGEKKDGELTGYIDCTLTTKTETFVPDTDPKNIKKETLKKGEFPSYIFYSYGDNKPVIPGSEIRGMLRSDFEIFTDSCMSTINKDKSFISRTKEVKNPGILEKDDNGNWHLFKATRYALHTARFDAGKIAQAGDKKEAIYMVDNYNKILSDKNEIKSKDGKTVIKLLEDGVKEYKTGDKVNFFAASWISRPYVKEINSEGNKEGILFIGETGGKKSRDKIHDSIFEKGEEIENVTDLNTSVRKLKEIYDMYNDRAFNKNLNENMTWYSGYDIDKLESVPVWYSDLDENGRTYLSMAAMGKEAYHRTLNELLNVTGNVSESYIPCINSDCLCKTCSLFGYVSDDSAKGSKIRISDAKCVEKDNYYNKERIINELASPHIANAAFYSMYINNEMLLDSTEDMDWNYDFVFFKGGIKPISSDDITIRGRKVYWHHKPIISENIKKTERNCAIKPVKENYNFKFKVYFENITEEDLKQLIAVINLKYESEKKYNGNDYYDLCHKIGKAKPLGYGSVKLNVDKVCVREVKLENNTVSYNMKDRNDLIENATLNNLFNMETDAMKDVLRIYNFNYLSVNYPDVKVTYPLSAHPSSAKVPIASHYWFMDNKNDSIKHPYIRMVLPYIKDGKEFEYEGLKSKENSENKENKGVLRKIDGLKLPKYRKE